LTWLAFAGPTRRPHHVTQRGNGRARTCFGDHDYALYRELLAENCRAAWRRKPREERSNGK
jgi:hypothetical protein